MTPIAWDVNGRTHAIDADPDMPLLYALRNYTRRNNPYFGCGLADAAPLGLTAVPFSPHRVRPVALVS